MPRPIDKNDALERAARIRQRRENSSWFKKKKEESEQKTAPTAVSNEGGSSSISNRAKYQVTGDTDLYYKNAEKASTNSTRTTSRFSDPKTYGVRGDRVYPSGYHSDNGIRNKSRLGAGKLRTTSENGTTRYLYERSGNNANVNTSYGYTAAENGTWKQDRVSPAANKHASNVDGNRPSKYLTQESANTRKYDDGRHTEYFEKQHGKWVSVPEERYRQTKLLDGGVNPTTLTPYKRVEAAAEHGIKNAVHGLKSTIGSIKANTNEEQRARDYAATHKNGNNLNRRRDMLMNSYGAAAATRNGNDAKANEYIKQEAFEDIMNERRQLERQRKIDQKYETIRSDSSKPMQFAMDVVDTTANMVPGMVSNAVLPGSFIPEMAVQAYGNSYNQARNNGATRDEAIRSGIMNAAVESLSESLFAGGRAFGKATGVSGIFHPGREIERASLGFIKSTAGKDVVRAVQKLGLAGAEEGAEEIVAGLAEPVLDALIYQGGVDTLKDKEFWTSTVRDALYNGLVGFASGGGFGAVDVVQSIREGSDIRAHADVANMINQALAMPEDSRAYSLARSLDNQIQAGQNLGNLDVSDLSRAVQEQQAEINKRISKEQDNTEQVMRREGLFNRSEPAEASYERAMKSESEAEQAIAEGASEQEAAEVRVSMSAQGEEYGRYYEMARNALADRLMPAMTEEASEDLDIVEAVRNSAMQQAEDGARTIARVMMGEATVEDFHKFGTTNPAIREAYEEITGKSIPEGNKAAANFMINENENHYIAEQRNDKSRALLAYADAVFGDKSGASEAFRKSMGDLSNVDANELEGMIRGFSDAYTIGRASEPNATLPRRTDMMQFLTDSQIEAAFEAGKADRRARSEMVKAAEEKIAAAKKSGKRKPKLDHDVASNLNEKERGSEKAKKAIEDMQILQDALNVKITLETARTTADSGNPESSEGWYDKDGIHLNIDANIKAKPLEVVFSHEFTHHLQRYAPKEYQALVEFVIEAKTNNNMQAWERMVEQKMVDYGNAGVELTRDQAIDEIVADMAYEFLNNEQTVERLFAYDATLAEKIKKVMLNMIDKILKFFKTHGSQWKGMEADLNKARQMWLDAAEAARENGDLNVKGSTQFSIEDVLKVLSAKQRAAVSYDALVSKPDMKIVQLDGAITNDRAAIIKAGKDDIKKYEQNAGAGNIYVPDINRTVIIGRPALEHGLHRENTESVEIAVRKAGELLKNSILVNYCKPLTSESVEAFILLAYGETSAGEVVPSYFVVDTLKTGVTEVRYFDRAYSVNGRKIGGVGKTARAFQGPTPPTISIEDLLSVVNADFSDILSQDVIDHFGVSRLNTKLAGNVLYSLGMTEKNGKAAWLPERIDDLMQRYGGTGNYSQAWAVMMNPRDFLKLTLSDDQLDRWSSSAQNVPGEVQGMPYREAVDRVWNRAKETGEWIHDNENYPLDQEELASNEQTPFISIYEDSAGRIHVDGHEGRHRMRALMEAGINSVPVVVKDLSTKYSKTNIDSMTLGSQDFGRGPVNSNASVTVTDLVPIRRDNRDELMEKFGAKDNDQVKFSISAEEDREYLAAVRRGDMETAQRMVDEAAKRNGYSIESFHGTRAKFSKFKPNSHFGTNIYQALDRLGFYNDILDEYEDDPEVQDLLNRAENSGAVVMRLYIKANNPIEVSDLGNWDFDYLTRYLPEYLPDSDIDWASLKSTSDVISALRYEGYDSIVYENIHEGRDDDEGDNNAYILFDPHQAKLADPVTYDDNGDVIPLSKRFDATNNDVRYSLSVDSTGRQLSRGQQEYFKNSKARDKQGRLRVLYHSSPAQFYEFDNDRLGDNTGYDNTAFGHFVTDYKPFSERFGENQMELYAKIDKLAIHPFGAATKYSGEELEQITRNWLELTDPEQLNVYEEYKQDDPDLSLYDFYMDLWVGDDPFEYAEDQRELLENAGYDGVELFEGNENQLSGDNSGEEKPVTTYAVFNSNQLKDVTNENPTVNPDIRYSLSEDTSGRTLTAAQREFFKDSKIRDEQGRLKVMYHGTNNEFTVFDFSQGGKNGTAEGYGIYTSDREDVSRHYGGRLIEGYVNITRPAASDQKTIKRSELKKLIKATVDAEAQRLAEDYDGDVAAAAKDTWISNYTYTYDKSLDAAIDEVAGTILDLNDNDMDIVQEVMGGMAIRDYNEAEQFYDVLTDVTGIDGFVTDWEDSNTGESSRIALAFRSNQIKNVTNENPTANPDIRYSISTPMSELDHTDKTVADSNGNPVAKFDRAGGVQFSISTYEDKGREVLNKYLNNMVLQGDMDQDEADQIRDELEKVYGICKEYADTKRYVPFTAWSYAEVVRGANGRPVFSAIKNNSEYKMNIDFSTICKKRRTLDAIFNELVNRGFFDRFDLNKEDSAAFVVKMNDIIRKNGFEAACALCFVEARRYRQQQTAMTFRDMWNDLVKSMYKDESKISHFNFGQDDTARMVEDGIHTMKDSDLDLTYLKKVAKSKGVPSRAAKLLLEDPSQRKLMRTGDMMSSVGFENFQVQNPKLMKIYNAKKGTGGAKSSFGDVQYFHEIIGSRNKTFSRNKAYKVGGVRIQSFSDYVPRMVFDYVEMVADLAAKRLPAHAYTKEALFAKQFGLTGIKINLSLVPDVVKGGKAVGLDKNGDYAWNEEGTFPYDEAEKLIKAEGYKDNVGTIAVGVSDEQIRKMLADPNIMMVIPYHKSSLNPIVAEMTNVDAFTDYTDFQNTKDENGKTVKRDFDWDGKLHKLSHGKDGKLLPKDQWGNIQDVVKEYADWCKARNYTPKFSQFLYMKNGSINPGYYKMLEDFSLLSVDGEFTPQDDVRMKFPTESDAFGSMADLIAEGLDADAILEGKRSKKVAPIADEIEALAESGELLSDLNQRDVDVVKNFMETTDVTKGHQPQFSLASDRDREIADLQNKVERLQRDKRRTYGREASDADARRVARALLADTSSDFSLNQTIKAVKELFTMIKRGDDFADIYGYVQGIARSVADASYDMVEIPGASDLANLRQRFLDARKSQGGSPLKILVPQNLIGDFDRVGGWKEFRAAHKGIVTLSVNSGESYDTFVEAIAEEFGEQYRAEGDNSGIDTLIGIIEAADSKEARNPVRKAYKDEDVEGAVPDDVDMGIMGGYRDTEVNEIIDRLLDDVADQIAPDLTFADKKAAEKDAAVKKERAKWEARREQWRKDRDKRIAEMKEDKKLAVEAQRAKGKERLQKQAELYRRQREKARERRADTASRRKTLDRIYKTTQRLSQKLLKPTDSQHVPEKYRKAVADMLGWLDFENARTDAWAKRHGNVPSARILNMRKLQEVYAKIAEDEQLNQYIEPDDQIYEWLEYLSDIEGSRLDDLTTEQLRTVRLVLDAVSWQVNNADKALTEGLKQSRAEMATELMDELEAQKGEKLKDGVIKKFLKSDATPVHFFDRLGLNVFKKLYQQLTLAQDTHIKHLSEAQEYIEKNITSKWGNTAKIGNNSLIKKWTEEANKYKLENGKTVEMTGAQVMSLYALNKREQARKHLLGGGIVIAPTKVKRNLKGGVKEYLLNKELQKTRAELTYTDITNILNKMSKEQIDAAEAMLKYLKTTSEWGNETSMKLYGYRKFTEDNYFPIQSAKEFIAGSNLELQRDKKIKNQGMTKNVNEYANNPIVIDDFFEVTTAHINQMSQYNAFVPILEDFDRIYQYSEYDPESQKYRRSVKELIEQKHGRWAADYIENLLKNVNGNFGNEVADIQGFEKLLRNWKAAKIGLSIRVLAQQPTAVVRAFNEIDPKYFVGTPRRGSHKRMWEICPIAEWKHWGYSQTDIHRSMRDTMMGDKHLSDKLFFDMYGKADDLGWGAIFDAVERETKDLMKKGKLKFEYDSAEYRQHVNERFRHIVDRTQVVDSVLHRSQLMRSQNTFTKATTAFMAEPTISVNTIMTAFTKAQEEARAGHKAAAAKAAGRGVSVFVANAVAVSVMASLISAIRESYLPDDDDDEEKELTKLQQILVDKGYEEGSFLYDWLSGYFIEDFKDNINPLMMIPVAKDMLNMWQGYEAPNPMYQLPQSLIQTTQNMKKWIDEDGDTRYSGRYYIERTAESMAELFGIPAANIRKELIGIQNIYFRAISEKEYGDYLQDRWELNEDYKGNKNTFIDHYLNAKKAGHDESAKDIREQLLKSKVKDDDGNLVFTDDAIQKRAWSVYAPNFKDDVIAGKDVSKQEKDLKRVGVSQEDIDDKKGKALVSAVSDAVEMGDTKRINNLYDALEKYGYDEYDVDKKVKSAASDLMYDAIDAQNYDDADRYIKVITKTTGYSRDDVVSSITTHYMSDYYDATDAGDRNGVKRVKNILNRYGVTSNDIREKEAEHYKDYYRQKAYMAYANGDVDEAYRIATEYNNRYPGVYAKGVDGMIYGIQNLSDSTVDRYKSSSKFDEWEIPW